MFQYCMEICMQAIAACLSWFDQFRERLGFTNILLGMALILISYRFILQPIFGRGISAFSDKAKRIHDRKAE